MGKTQPNCYSPRCRISGNFHEGIGDLDNLELGLQIISKSD